MGRGGVDAGAGDRTVNKRYCLALHEQGVSHDRAAANPMAGAGIGPGWARPYADGTVADQDVMANISIPGQIKALSPAPGSVIRVLPSEGVMG